MDSRDISKLSRQEIYDLLDRGDLPIALERELTLELRRQTMNDKVDWVTTSQVDFFWEMQLDIASDFIDEYLEDVNISPQAKRAVRERALNDVLLQRTIVYQEGEYILDIIDMGLLVESLAEDYPTLDELEERRREKRLEVERARQREREAQEDLLRKEAIERSRLRQEARRQNRPARVRNRLERRRGR